MPAAVQDGKSYDGVQQRHAYETDGGFLVCPVAGRTPKFRRIRLHGGVGYRRVHWSMDRQGKPPFIPAATDISNTDLLLSTVVQPSLPSPQPEQGGYQWHVEGEYLFVQQTPRVAGVNAFPTGGFPFVITPNDQLASQLVSQYAAAFGAVLGGAAAVTMTPEMLYNAVGLKALTQTDYVWPFTAIPAAFSSPVPFGA